MARIRSASRDYHLTYCTNVHPAGTLEEVERNLDRYTVAVKAAVFPDRPMGLGLHLPDPVLRELLEGPDGIAAFRARLEDRGFYVFTLNAFPYGGFHAERVKEGVFRPTWSEMERLSYTRKAGEVLARLLPEGITGSISTHGGGWRGWRPCAAVRQRMVRHIADVVAGYAALERETGRRIVLCVEPEPLSTTGTLEEAVAFLRDELAPAAREDVVARAGVQASRAGEVVRRHLGLCLDLCHLACDFADPLEAPAMLHREGIPVGKVQVGSALEVLRPGEDPEGVAALLAYAEPRYLHQLRARLADGRVLEAPDIEGWDPPATFLAAEAWRCHFHLPPFEGVAAPLRTTAAETAAALRALDGAGSCTHLECETYTWGVLPGGAPDDAWLVDGIARELRWTLDAVGAR